MPYSDSLPDTIICGSTDLQGLTGVSVLDLTGLFAPGTRRGEDDVTPRLQGQTGAPGLVFDAYAFTIPVLIQGTTRAATIANLRALTTACVGSGGLVALTRRLSDAAGPGYVAHTANGRFVGYGGFEFPGPGADFAIATELQFVNLSGAWLSGSTWIFP